MPETHKTDVFEPVGDEKRPATSPLADHLDADDRSAVVVPTTAELAPLPTDDASEPLRLLQDAVDGLERSDDWLQQYECVLIARRVVVFAPWSVSTLPSALLAQLTLAGDDLRSALARNALLALAESFEFLPLDELAVSYSLVDMLLRRCVCEKRFLRDAALLAVAKLSQHVAGAPLMATAAQFASSKNARLCGHAAGIITASLERLAQQGATITTPPARVFQALAALREAKDAAARAQAATSFKLLAKLMGHELFTAGLRAALGPQATLAAARIAKEACACTANSASLLATEPPVVRRGSLRDRMRLESRSKAC